jgi:hypothetical protein
LASLAKDCGLGSSKAAACRDRTADRAGSVAPQHHARSYKRPVLMNTESGQLTADNSPGTLKQMLSHAHELLAEIHGHESTIAHHIPGRMRLKVPQAYSDPTLLRQMKVTFDKMRGVKASEIKFSSASLVLYYDESDPEAFLTLDLAHRNLPSADECDPTQIADGPLKAVFALDRHGWREPVSGELPLVRHVLPLILATVFEVCVGAAPPLWLSLASLLLKMLRRAAGARAVATME